MSPLQQKPDMSDGRVGHQQLLSATTFLKRMPEAGTPFPHAAAGPLQYGNQKHPPPMTAEHQGQDVRYTYKTSKDKTSKDKTSKDKTSNDKTSKGTKRRKTKRQK